MAALDWSQCPAVESIPGKVSGAWVFKGTRLPVATVIENLEDLSIDEVIEQYDVTRGLARCPHTRSTRRNPEAGTRSATAHCWTPPRKPASKCCSRPTGVSGTNRTCKHAASPWSF